MPNRIEVVPWPDARQVLELAHATYENDEPGFQVEGIHKYRQLQGLFELLIVAAPREIASTLRAGYPHATANNLGKNERGLYTGVVNPHFDNGWRGLTVHHNISDVIPVELGVSNRHDIYRGDPSDPKIDPQFAHNIRTGEACPGTLTIFSVGGEDGTDFMPTIHSFDRSNVRGFHKAARYAISSTVRGDQMRKPLPFIARQAFREQALAIAA